MALREKLVTAEELLRMPDDGVRRELVEGKLREMTPAGSEHGHLALKIGRLLGNHVEDNALGRVYAAETGFRLASDPDTVRAGRGVRVPGARGAGRERGGLLARRAGSGGRGGLAGRPALGGGGEGALVAGGRVPYGAGRGPRARGRNGLPLARGHPHPAPRRYRGRRRRGSRVALARRGDLRLGA